MPSSHLIHYIKDLLERNSKNLTYQNLWESDKLPESVVEDFSNAIFKAIEHEKALEDLRNCIFNIGLEEASLAWQSTLQILFETVDTKQKGSISKSRLQNLLIEKAEYFASQRETNSLFNRFDKQMKGCIEVEDFLLEMKPRFNQVEESIIEDEEY